jgi:hypothetical protein
MLGQGQVEAFVSADLFSLPAVLPRGDCVGCTACKAQHEVVLRALRRDVTELVTVRACLACVTWHVVLGLSRTTVVRTASQEVR